MKILLVDDHKLIGKSLEMTLKTMQVLKSLDIFQIQSRFLK